MLILVNFLNFLTINFVFQNFLCIFAQRDKADMGFLANSSLKSVNSLLREKMTWQYVLLTLSSWLCGGIGRHACLKNKCRETYRFKSGQSYKSPTLAKEQNKTFKETNSNFNLRDGNTGRMALQVRLLLLRQLDDHIQPQYGGIGRHGVQ